MTGYDVVVVGGGPAGSVTAAILARAGHSVLVLEGKRFPRPHIGESLLGMSMGLLRDCGALPRIEEAGFVYKPGAVFIWGGTGMKMHLSMSYPRYAYQVSRERFDTLLLEHAEESGAEVRQEWWARDPLFDTDGRVQGVALTAGGRDAGAVECRYLVDASGLFQFLPRRLGLPLELDGRRRIALSSYYKGAARMDPPHGGTILSEACPDGWLWFIPLDDDTTSVGFVSDEDCVEGDPQAVLDAQIAATDLTSSLLRGSAPERRARVLKYTNHLVAAPLWRDGYVLAGDTALFVDPLFSTGVHGAVYSASLAAACLQAVFIGAMTDEEAAGLYDERLRAHYHRVSETVRILYGLHPGESAFWRSRNLDRMDTEEAERTVRALGVNGMSFFYNAVRVGALSLPPVLDGLLGEFHIQAKADPLAADSLLRLAPEVGKTYEWVLHESRLVRGVVLRHARARTQVVEHALDTPYGRFLDAFEGMVPLGDLVRRTARSTEEETVLPRFAGALVSGGHLSMAQTGVRPPDGVPVPAAATLTPTTGTDA